MGLSDTLNILAEDFSLGLAGIYDKITGDTSAARGYATWNNLSPDVAAQLEQQEQSAGGVLEKAQAATGNQLANPFGIDIATLLEFAVVLLAVAYGLYVVTIVVPA